MRKGIILSVLVAMLLAPSCDFIRTVAGRPTRAQLEKARLELQQKEEAERLARIAAEQARIDSLERVRKHMADSLAALEAHILDSLSQTKGTIVNSSKLGGMYTTKLETKYCIVVGAFRNRTYAERKLKACNEAGYTATIVSFRNGLNAVAVCPSNDLRATINKRNALKGKGIYPKDSWILINE